TALLRTKERIVLQIGSIHPGTKGLILETRLRERIEVVAATDIDDRLAPVLHLLEIPHLFVGQREGHVRAMTKLGRSLTSLRALNDLARRQPTTLNPADGRLQHLPVVGQLLGARGIAG